MHFLYQSKSEQPVEDKIITIVHRTGTDSVSPAALPIFPGGPVSGVQHLIPQEGTNINNGKVTITPMLPPAAVAMGHPPGVPVSGVAPAMHSAYGPGMAYAVGYPPGYHAMPPPQVMPGMATIQQPITLRYANKYSTLRTC